MVSPEELKALADLIADNKLCSGSQLVRYDGVMSSNT